MNLFEINREIKACVKLPNSDNYVSVETGEIIDQQALDQLVMDRDKKIRNIACWIRNLDAEEEALDKQEKIFRDRKNAAKRKKESLKSYLAAFLNGNKWRNDEVNITFRKSESVEITDLKVISKYYLRYKPAEADKTLIKKDLKAGQAVQGAMLVSKQNISVN